MTRVTVYSFKVWNYQLGEFTSSPHRGMRRAIEAIGGKIIEDSEISVPTSQIDANGFVKPD